MAVYTGTTGADVLQSSNTASSTTIDTLIGLDGDDILIGGIGNDTLQGGNGDDVLLGGAGNDTLDGGTGSNAMYGGVGNDVYLVGSATDQINENFGEGTDTVIASVSFDLSPYDNVENITAKAGTTAGINLIGSDGDNVLDGVQNTTVNTLTGGLGNDTYLVGSTDVIVEASGGGNDTVKAAFSIDLTLTAYQNVENAVLTGSTLGNLKGDANVNILTGSTGNNTIDGGAGADTMIGMGGTDTFMVDNTLDVVTGGSGVDLVVSSVSYSLASSALIEKLTLTGSAVTGTGNALANTITGTSGNNTLDGGAGADTMIGGGGNDTYMVDSATDVVTAGAGSDTVVVNIASVTLAYSIAAATAVENVTLGASTSVVTLTGNTGVNILTGNAGNNTLDGGTGADTMIGGAGNDVYNVDNAGDSITENASEGTDQVNFNSTTVAATYTLGANVENLTLLGSTAINGTGNTAANVITGNGAANVLDDGGVLVGGGQDTLVGGLGNDTYVIYNANTKITEASGTGTGTDTVQFHAAADGDAYSLSASAANVENLTLFGDKASVATGNSGVNVITGDNGNNTLDGGGGTDILKGGNGNDLYKIHTGTEVITETATGGTDTAALQSDFSGTSYSLSSFIENLDMSATSGNFNGFGNAQANSITGNGGNNTLMGGSGNDIVNGGAGNDSIDGGSGNDTLDGGTGNDTMTGGMGNDTFYVDASTDVVNENAGEGTDIVHSTATTFTLNANVDNLTLDGSGNISGVGNSGDNVITGNAGNNTIDGGGDVLGDTLVGGAGNDVYVIYSGNETITETSGTDELRSGLVNIDLSTYSGIENATATGALSLTLTGTTGDNTLTANNAGDILDGNGSSAGDTLIGGSGNDMFFVHSTNDHATGGGGFDGLFSGQISLDLTNANYSGIHNATLTGSSNLNIVGDNSGDDLDGNAGNNTITGGSAGDVLSAGTAGTDTLIGGGGNDIYLVDHAGVTVTEGASAGTDEVDVSNISSYTLATNVENLVMGSGVTIGTGNALDNIITGNSLDNTLSGGGHVSADTFIGGDGNDTYTVISGDIVTENTGEGTDTVQSSTISLNLSSYANVENLTLTGSSNLNLTGDAGDNVLTGNSGNNTLDGGGDSVGDTLIGGGGTDVYIIHSGNEVVTGGGGTDTVQSSLVSLDLTNANYTSIENATLTGSTALNLTGNSSANVLTGNSGDNTIVGGGGADTYDGNGGHDVFTGGAGVDYYNITATPGAANTATITNFDNSGGGDVLDIHSVLTGYTSGSVSNWVELQDNGGNTEVLVDAAGTGSAYVLVATLNGITGLAGTEDALVTAGTLVVT